MLTSERVQLRKMVMEDSEIYHSWRNDLEVMNSTSLSLDLYTYEETKAFVENVILSSTTSKSYMITDVNTDIAIGIVSLINIDSKNRNAECIIDIGNKDYWGKGYGQESLALLLDYAFLEMNLHRISLRVFSFNKKAIHLYKKLGFVQEGLSRESLFRKGKWHDIIQMGLLRSEYKESM
ncbi:acetyltransferase [Alkalihalobacillus alcalophilus ATCC 27647 = CGMCC 1.3604]|uniref:Acetyltransferase n=1 Tax=Alkalihalobacillus alcalophilus ATCC 27647 = CGMCC 1.3604 TaxID=1218173 RepID=A0A094XJI4_ALKAL|nr:GNAT family protein [Alkalihalobacillus alcalophilus]KGA98925.1 acetyltransferase [Alkalihalobacillus alcalophilus ATCC 27647 = CGMCC 1.3604]MED1561957.1 GNAT family protein [Alkalihalobacillus alcalophilus]THG88453.1 acetyltransferase [Alkalihalobacillus alcalophilus ATCC 27647 = CGMCC 1.3604]